MNRGNLLEENARFVDRHFEDVRDTFPAKGHLQSFVVIPSSATGLAGDVDIAQKVHVDLDESVALACFASAARDVEAESARLVTALTTDGQFAEQIANRAENTDVGCRI